jgi:uncharacterized protein (TIGR02118 family)
VIGELVSRFDEENVTITRLAIPTAVMVESPSGDVGPGAAVGPTSKKKSIRRKSMIRVSVLYPQKEGASFDHEYYARKHIPFVRETLEPFGMVRAEVDKGLAGGPGESPLFVAAAHLIFQSLDQFQEAFASVGDQLMADIPNYTDIEPQIQFSEMVD